MSLRAILRRFRGALRRGEFDAHWFETGTPAFLVDTLFERRVSSVSLDGMVSTAELLSAFDVHHIGTEALLFQTGYLTATREERLGGVALYRLGYPNREVRESLNPVLLRHLVQDAAQQTASSIRLERLLEAHGIAGLKEMFHAFFASIPYQWYTGNHIADHEGFYASVFYSDFAALGYDIAVEESSSHGRLDMAGVAGRGDNRGALGLALLGPVYRGTGARHLTRELLVIGHSNGSGR